MSHLRQLSAAALGGLMTLNSCGGSQRSSSAAPTKLQHAAVNPQEHAAKSDETEPQTSGERGRSYLSPPKTRGELMDAMIICHATQISAQAFIETQRQIAATKGCRIIQALYEEGERVMEACDPIAELKEPLTLEIVGVVSSVRAQMDSVETQMQALKKMNAHCFEKSESPLCLPSGRCVTTEWK